MENDTTQYKLTKIGLSDSYLVTNYGSEIPEEIIGNTNISDPMTYVINDYDNKISLPGKFIFQSETPTFIIDDNQLNVFNTDRENLIRFQNGDNILDNLTNNSNTDYYITLDNGQVAILKGQAIPNQHQAEEMRNDIFIQEDIPNVQSPLKPVYEVASLQNSEAPKKNTSKALAFE